MNNTKKLPTTGIKPAIESFFAISVCHFCNQSGCKGIIFIDYSYSTVAGDNSVIHVLSPRPESIFLRINRENLHIHVFDLNVPPGFYAHDHFIDCFLCSLDLH